jgi:hypothetical protein
MQVIETFELFRKIQSDQSLHLLTLHLCFRDLVGSVLSQEDSLKAYFSSVRNFNPLDTRKLNVPYCILARYPDDMASTFQSIVIELLEQKKPADIFCLMAGFLFMLAVAGYAPKSDFHGGL